MVILVGILPINVNVFFLYLLNEREIIILKEVKQLGRLAVVVIDTRQSLDFCRSKLIPKPINFKICENDMENNMMSK